MPDSKVAGIILAAGQGQRFGADKLLIPLAGRPLAGWALEAALASDLARVVLVTRPELAQALEKDHPRLRVVLNPTPELGQALSLKLGLSCVEPICSHILFLLADQPLVSAGLINRFLDLARQGVELAALQEGGRLRPPALFGRRYFPELARLEGDQGGRSLLERYASRVRPVPPERPGQGADVDQPGDLGPLEDILTSRRGLAACLGLGPAEFISLVGAGGKTSLMQALAAELAGTGARVLCATTTRIYRPPGPLLLAAGEQALRREIAEALAPGRSLTIGAGLEPAGGRQKVVGLPPGTLDWLWGQGLADYLLVEADGAQGRPLKAPRAHEPVVPAHSTLVVGVLGLSGLGQPADPASVFALPEFCAATGAEEGQAITPAHLAALIRHPAGLFKGAPPAARRVVLLNQAELSGAAQRAEEVRRGLGEPASKLSLVSASLRKGACRSLT